jgi:hypothetical protein
MLSERVPDIAIMNFTWKLLNYTESEMKIKLNFSNTYSISLHSIQDILVFHIKKESPLFFCNGVDKQLHLSSWTLERKIPKQMVDTKLLRKTISTAKSTINLAMVVLIVLFGLSAYMGDGAQKYMDWYLKSLQIILHLPMLKTIIPGNVSVFFQMLVPVVTFDYLDPDWTTRMVFEFDDEKQEELAEEFTLDQM